MKQFRIEKIVLDQLSESVQALVEKNYFSDEDYAVSYLTDIVRFFQLNVAERFSISFLDGGKYGEQFIKTDSQHGTLDGQKSGRRIYTGR